MLGLLTSLATAADTAVADPVTTAIATGLGALLTTLTGVQLHRAGETNAQLAGLRSDLQAHRAEQDKRMREHEERVGLLEERVDALEDPRRTTRTTGAQSTTRGRQPARPSSRR